MDTDGRHANCDLDGCDAIPALYGGSSTDSLLITGS